MSDKNKDSQETEKKDETHTEKPMEMVKTPKIPVRSEFSSNKENSNKE